LGIIIGFVDTEKQKSLQMFNLQAFVCFDF